MPNKYTRIIGFVALACTIIGVLGIVVAASSTSTLSGMQPYHLLLFFFVPAVVLGVAWLVVKAVTGRAGGAQDR